MDSLDSLRGTKEAGKDPSDSQRGTREARKAHLDSLRGTREAGMDSLDSLRGTREAGKDPSDSQRGTREAPGEAPGRHQRAIWRYQGGRKESFAPPGRHQGGSRETRRTGLPIESRFWKGPGLNCNASLRFSGFVHKCKELPLGSTAVQGTAVAERELTI